MEMSERPTGIMMDIKIRKTRATKRIPRKMGIKKIREQTTVRANS